MMRTEDSMNSDTMLVGGLLIWIEYLKEYFDFQNSHHIGVFESSCTKNLNLEYG